MNKYSPYKIAWKPEKLKSFIENKITAPIYVRIKPTNRCNHNCWFCVYRYDFSHMHKDCDRVSEIPYEKLRSIISNLWDIGTKAITFSGGGEPLIYKGINEILKLTKYYGLQCSVITNGSRLSGDTAEILYDADWVRISMDYFDEDSYIHSRGVKGVDKIYNNIRNFAKNRKNCDLEINYVVTRNNANKLFRMAKRVKDLGVDNIRFSPMWCVDFKKYHKSIEVCVLKQIEKAQKELNDDNFKVISSYNINNKKSKRDYDKCYFNQISPTIGADLNVYTCHNKAYDEKGKIGSIKDKSFKKMWFSKETETFFNEFNTGCCNHECANDKKNILINNIIDGYGDDFI